MGTFFTREELEGKNVKDLRAMVIDSGLTGISKKRKDVLIDSLVALGEPDDNVNDSGEMAGIEFNATSIMTKPDAKDGDKTTTTIHVSCGASSGNFPVVGKTVKEVGDFLREVLNVDRMSTGLVNGKQVDPDYVLAEDDNLEYLKPAGRKG
ncbi:MAG: hypothetical protein ACTSWJ_10945 [Candidatus Heimdallarchaeaceae archaeon]